METIFYFIKKLIPSFIFKKIQPIYHWLINGFSAVLYNFPSNKLIVIGVTGTTGKTTTVYFLAQILREAGIKAGYTSTAMFSDGKKDWLNNKKMTMLGRFFTQKMLRQMVNNKCQVAIIETTSEGIRQFRHRFINYDILVFTGIYPEHIESHGSFKNYKQAKLELFRHLEKHCHSKNLDKSFQKFYPLLKTIVVNGDDKYYKEFLNFSLSQKIILQKTSFPQKITQKNQLTYFSYTPKEKNVFYFNQKKIALKILGNFNILNASLASSVAKVLKVKESVIKKGIEKINNIPGRIEKIQLGQDFDVIVDYAFEPKALASLYKTILENFSPQKIIHILGATGGGRDKKRRKPLGEIAGKNADIVILTNEDPYDEDPIKIINEVAKGVKKFGKKENKNLFLIENRERAIEKGIQLAEKNDLVLITGKGSEQAICIASGKKIPWDDRKIVSKKIKEKLKKLSNPINK